MVSTMGGGRTNLQLNLRQYLGKCRVARRFEWKPIGWLVLLNERGVCMYCQGSETLDPE